MMSAGEMAPASGPRNAGGRGNDEAMLSGRPRSITRIAIACAVLVAVGGCAGALAPSASAGIPGLAGTWSGRMFGPYGHAVATMTIKEDGAYTGTMFLDDGDKDFGGSLIAIGRGTVRYQGTYGNGAVTLREERGQRVLRFVPDGGGGGATFTAVERE